MELNKKDIGRKIAEERKDMKIPKKQKALKKIADIMGVSCKALSNMKKIPKKYKAQGEFVRILGVSCKALSNWENGHCFPQIEDLVNMCEIFECDLEWLLCYPEFNCRTKSTTDIHKEIGLSKKACEKLDIKNKNNTPFSDEQKKALEFIIIHGENFLNLFYQYVILNYEFFSAEASEGNVPVKDVSIPVTYDNGETYFKLKAKEINDIHRSKLVKEIDDLRKIAIKSKENDNNV